MLEIARKEKMGPKGAFIKDSNNNWVPNPVIKTALYDLYYHCMRTNVSRMAEWDTTPTEYFEKYNAFLEAGQK